MRQNAQAIGAPRPVQNGQINKANATSITNIEERTSAFIAYMSVITSKLQSRAAELLEYLIRS